MMKRVFVILTFYFISSCSTIQEPLFSCDTTTYCSNLVPLNCTSRKGSPYEIIAEKNYTTVLPASPRNLRIQTEISKQGSDKFDVTILWKAPDDASVRYLTGFDVQITSPNIQAVPFSRHIISLSDSISSYKDCENDVWFFLHCEASKVIQPALIIVSSVPKPSHLYRNSSKEIKLILPSITTGNNLDTNISNLSCSKNNLLESPRAGPNVVEENNALLVIVTVVLLAFLTVTVIIFFIWKKGIMEQCKPKQRNGEEGIDSQYNNEVIHYQHDVSVPCESLDKEVPGYFVNADADVEEAVTLGDGSFGMPSTYAERKNICSQPKSRSDFLNPSEMCFDENFNPSTVAVEFNYQRDRSNENDFDEINIKSTFQASEYDESDCENNRLTGSDYGSDGISV